MCTLCTHKRTTTVCGPCALNYCEEYIDPHTYGDDNVYGAQELHKDLYH